MSLKTFLQQNNITSIEIIPNITILNIICNDIIYGLDVDTSNVLANTPLTITSEYIIENDILLVGSLSVDTNTTNLLMERTNVTPV